MVKNGSTRDSKSLVCGTVQQVAFLLKEAITRTGTVYAGRSVKDGKEVVDYLLVEVFVMLQQMNDRSISSRLEGLCYERKDSVGSLSDSCESSPARLDHCR